MPGLMGRTIMAMASRAVGRSIGGASAGPLGLAIGVALPMLTRTLGPAGMVALAVGSWAVRRAVKQKAQLTPRSPGAPHPPAAAPPASAAD